MQAVETPRARVAHVWEAAWRLPVRHALAAPACMNMVCFALHNVDVVVCFCGARSDSAFQSPRACQCQADTSNSRDRSGTQSARPQDDKTCESACAWHWYLARLAQGSSLRLRRSPTYLALSLELPDCAPRHQEGQPLALLSANWQTAAMDHVCPGRQPAKLASNRIFHAPRSWMQLAPMHYHSDRVSSLHHNASLDQ
jgi:hypothetical protein